MNFNISGIVHSKWFIPSVVGIVSFTVGGGTGYIYGRQRALRMPDHFDIQEENPQMSLFDQPDYSTMDIPSYERIQVDPIDYDVVVEQAVEVSEETEEYVDWPEPEKSAPPRRTDYSALAQSDETAEEQSEPEPEPVTVNVFDHTDEWDWDAEADKRSRELPYIIHVDEFVADNMGCTQETLTYYAMDDIMADQSDTPIYNYKGLMGELQFGHGSGDPNVCYIRNEAIRMEWEILLHTGSFEVEVRGFQIEKEYEEQDIRHSNLHKFRDD